MTTINAALLKALLNVPGLNDENAVFILQHGIDRLNTYGAGIPDLTAGAIIATSQQAGAILEAARLVYFGYYKGQETVSVSGLSIAMPNMLSNPMVEMALEKLANQLKGRSFLRT